MAAIARAKLVRTWMLLLFRPDLERFAVYNHIRPAEKTHRRTELVGTQGYGNLIAGLQGILAPASGLQNPRAIHFTCPMHDRAFVVLHVEQQIDMWVGPDELRDRAGE